MPRIALTATARYLDHTFSDWCFYHLRLVDRIFLWLDDPVELASPHLPRNSRLTVAVGAQTMNKSVHGTMMVRQNQNADHALSLCLRGGIDWLIHLDSDELLYPPERSALYRCLAGRSGQVRLMNHEVCPHWTSVNPFRECRHFKINGRMNFNFYSNGKSAVRVGSEVYACDAHSFSGYSGENSTANGPAVLHYACPTFERWLSKYAALGDFPDYWWDDPEHRISLPFHLASRDTLRGCLKEGNLEPARLLWASEVLTPPRLNRLMREGKVRCFATIL